MAQIETVYTATATEAELDDEVLNPDQTESTLGNHVTIDLTFDGVSIDAGDIYDMLNTQFGTVAQNKVAARGSYSFIISA